MSSAREQPGGRNHGEGKNSRSTACRSRKKVDRGIRSWFYLTAMGHAESMDVGKQMIKHHTGLSARDLRVLDPLLAYPSIILCRRRAVVVNLEHIKGVITAKDIWLLNGKDPTVALFIEELKRMMMNNSQEDVTKVLLDDV